MVSDSDNCVMFLAVIGFYSSFLGCSLGLKMMASILAFYDTTVQRFIHQILTNVVIPTFDVKGPYGLETGCQFTVGKNWVTIISFSIVFL